MNDAQTFQQFLRTEVTQADVISVVINLALAALAGLWIARTYVRWGRALSNRHAFAQNFVLLTMTTTLIITFLKENPVLSLGMIGALSIVRYRSAIKEPEELTYLFLAIAAGLGLGADQRLLTLGGVMAITVILWLTNRWSGKSKIAEQNLFLTIATSRPEAIPMGEINKLLAESCALHRLKRLDQSKETTEACFLVEPKTMDALHSIETSLRKLDDGVSVSLLDFRGGTLGAT